MLLDCVYILEHHPNLFLANIWALNCVGNFTGSNLFEPELDLNLWSSPRFRHLPEPNHRSSSRFTEILKEPDRTRLQQHYFRWDGFSDFGRVLSWIRCCMSDMAFGTFCLSSASNSVSAFLIDIPGRRERWRIIISGWILVSKNMRPVLLRRRVANPIQIIINILV